MGRLVAEPWTKHSPMLLKSVWLSFGDANEPLHRLNVSLLKYLPWARRIYPHLSGPTTVQCEPKGVNLLWYHERKTNDRNDDGSSMVSMVQIRRNSV